jgi:hypothetical protein
VKNDVSFYRVLVMKFTSQLLENLNVANFTDSSISGQEVNQCAPLGISANCSHNSSSLGYGSDSLLLRCSVKPFHALSFCFGVKMVEPAFITSDNVQ